MKFFFYGTKSSLSKQNSVISYNLQEKKEKKTNSLKRVQYQDLALIHDERDQITIIFFSRKVEGRESSGVGNVRARTCPQKQAHALVALAFYGQVKSRLTTGLEIRFDVWVLKLPVKNKNLFNHSN